MGHQLSLDELNRRLGEIQDRLLELGPEDFAARYELQLERDRLRKQSRRHSSDRDSNRPSQELLAELRARESALEQIRRGMVNSAAQAGGGGGGSGSFEGPLDGFKINHAMTSATGADKLMQRIARLETILKSAATCPDVKKSPRLSRSARSVWRAPDPRTPQGPCCARQGPTGRCRASGGTAPPPPSRRGSPTDRQLPPCRQ